MARKQDILDVVYTELSTDQVVVCFKRCFGEAGKLLEPEALLESAFEWMFTCGMKEGRYPPEA